MSSTLPSESARPAARPTGAIPCLEPAVTEPATSDPRADAPAPASALHRGAVLLYGVLCYLGFLGSFLYAIGFVSGWGVPKAINDGAAVPTPTALVTNTLLLSLFAVQHSIMARRWFKAWWTRIVPRPAERSTFVFATVVVLALIFRYWQPLPGVVWYVEGAAATALWVVAAVGWGIVLVSTFLIDHFDLFGLRQVVLHFRGIPYTNPQYQERWLYRVVRHPLLLGFLIAFWATPRMTVGHLFFAGVVTAYVLVAIRLEESDLVAEHGSSYDDYRRRVPMLLPGLRSRG